MNISRIIGPSPEQFSFVIDEMRNSWESWAKSDSCLLNHEGRQWYYFAFGRRDAALCRQLLKAGPDHAKFMRMLPVHATIHAPDYWWREFDTYRIGVAADDITQNSTSKMHIAAREPFSTDMFDFSALSASTARAIITELNELRDAWIADGRRKGPEAQAWLAMLQAIPDSWIYRRGVSLNYQAARAIYHARINHRLSEWRQFCQALTLLPYSWLITETAE